MLQAHSSLWNYLWVAPNILLLLLASLMWKRGLAKQFPTFLTFAVLSSIAELTVFVADIAPSVSAENFWRIDFASLLIEAILKFLLIAALFSHIFGPYPSLAKLGRILIRGVGVALVVCAALVDAFSPVSNSHWIVSGPHLLEQTIYMIESGLLLFVFLFSAYFRIRLDRKALGIALGLAISACVHLATRAVAANKDSTTISAIVDFTNMATYHVCVLIWFYYLLVPPKGVTKSAVSLPEHNLEVWNQELERLLQQ